MAKWARDQFFEGLREMLVETGVKEDDITDEANLEDDLAMDSLDRVEALMEIEDEFGVKISDDDARELKTFGNVVDYIFEHQSG